MKKNGSFLAIAFLLFASPAFAGDVTLFGGFQREGKLTLKSAASSAGSFTTNPTSFSTFGLRFGKAKTVGTESTFAYTSNFIDGSAKALILNQNLMIQAPTPVVKPYLTAGIGTIIKKGKSITGIGSRFAVNYGGGVKLKVAGPLGLRLDTRGYVIPGVQGQTLKVLEVSLGIGFGF